MLKCYRIRGDNRVPRVVEASSNDTSDDSDAASSSVDFPSDSESNDSANMFGSVLLCRTCIAVLQIPNESKLSPAGLAER